MAIIWKIITLILIVSVEVVLSTLSYMSDDDIYDGFAAYKDAFDEITNREWCLIFGSVIVYFLSNFAIAKFSDEILTMGFCLILSAIIYGFYFLYVIGICDRLREFVPAIAILILIGNVINSTAGHVATLSGIGIISTVIWWVVFISLIAFIGNTYIQNKRI